MYYIYSPKSISTRISLFGVLLLSLSSCLVDSESCPERDNPDIVEEENHQDNIPVWKARVMTMHKYAKISTVIITLGPLILPNCPTKLHVLVQRETQMPMKVLWENRQHQPGSHVALYIRLCVWLQPVINCPLTLSCHSMYSEKFLPGSHPVWLWVYCGWEKPVAEPLKCRQTQVRIVDREVVLERRISLLHHR